jgi:GxxExxY protein
VESAALTYQIIGAAIEVHNRLGSGFLESIYKSALIHELSLRGLNCETEVETCVSYKDYLVGKHRLDLR